MRQALLVLAIFQTAIHAQLTRSWISGTVTDSSGAVVPNVKIVITERFTGIRRASLTNDAGVYRFVAIESGIYSVVFEREGFETVRHDGIELSTAHEVVLNPMLTVAAAAAAVSVEAAAPGVQLSKATPSVERTIAQEVLESLPLTGIREVADIAILSPGVAVTGSDLTQTTYSANGQRIGANLVTLNGMDDKDPQYQFLTIRTQPEATSEIQVRTNSFSAEYGRGLGAQVSIVTRAGANRFHGEAFDYYGSNWMSAATFANKTAGLQDVRFSDHQAGGTFGGPLRRDRTFFFGLLTGNPTVDKAKLDAALGEVSR